MGLGKERDESGPGAMAWLPILCAMGAMPNVRSVTVTITRKDDRGKEFCPKQVANPL